MPPFAEPPSKPEARRRLGLSTDHRTVLVLSGGHGVGNVASIVAAVERGCSAIGGHSTVIVVCGRNDTLRSVLFDLPGSPHVDRMVVGFIDNMHDYMSAADLVVTKSGGLTSAEALAVGVPMIVVDPIPGQERHNADMLVEGGAAMIALEEGQLTYKVQRALGDADWLKRAGDASRRMGRPMAGKEILGRVVEEIGAN
jgi:processive 1,2-diacylglycerol beta-glucosyltransferase